MSAKLDKKSAFRYFGLLPWLFAPLFLFNPDYSFVDILPDFIGYLFLAMGLGKLQDINSYFEKASGSFLRLSLISGIKLVVYLLAAVLLDTKESPTMILIIMMLFAVGELIVAIPGFSAFFEGFYYAGFRYKENSKTAISGTPVKVRNTLLSFIAAKYLITILPEFSVLAAHSYSDSGTKWEEYTGLFRTVALMILLIAGIFVFIRVERFLIKTVRDRETLELLRKNYTESIVSKNGVFIRRRISLLCIFVILTIVFSADFLMDNADLLPDTVAALFWLLFFIYGKNYVRCRIPGIIVSSVYIPFTAFRWYLTLSFRDSHLYSMIHSNPSVYSDFVRYYPACVIEAVFEIFLIFITLIGLERIIREHCGYLASSTDGTDFSAKIREIRSCLNKKLNTWAIAAFASAAVSGLSEYAASFTQSYLCSCWSVISLIVSIISLYLFTSLNSEILTETGYKYMLT